MNSKSKTSMFTCVCVCVRVCVCVWHRRWAEYIGIEKDIDIYIYIYIYIHISISQRSVLCSRCSCCAEILGSKCEVNHERSFEDQGFPFYYSVI